MCPDAFEATYQTGVEWVLIPLISGHVSGLMSKEETKAALTVLIPLISGHVSGHRLRRGRGDSRVLIPLISGHVSGPRPESMSATATS